MPRLQPGQTPGHPIMQRPEPPVKKPEEKPEVAGYKACDQCGYSRIDGQSIARAQSRVYVRRGTLYFCEHHLQANLPYILEHGYYFRRLV